jgi:excisionase family DNA binding protein
MSSANVPRLDLLSVKEAADTLGVSRQRIRYLVDLGRLQAFRGPQGIRLIKRTGVEQFAAERQLERDVALRGDR